jgi:hypothetical protein
MHRRRWLLTLLVCLAAALTGYAQSSPSSQPVHITLGQSVVPLYGPWKFTVGDSPLDANGAPLWAQSGFDDSKWETVNLTPQAGLFDPLGGFSDYVKGWTAHGHAGHWGYGWYRIRVQVSAQPGEALGLAGPADVDDAYQFFLDGTLIGSFGKFSGSHPTIYYTQPMMFPLPQKHDADSQSDPQTQILAFRVWMEPSTLVTQADTGGFHTAPTLGNISAVSAGYQLRWLELIRTQIISAVEGLLFLLLAGIAFSLTRFDRSDPVYVWMGAIFLLVAVLEATSILGAWTQHIGALADNGLGDGILTPLIFGGWVMVWWIWFGLQRVDWVPKTVGLLTLCYMLSTAIAENTFYPFISVPVASLFHTISLAVRLALLVLLIIVVAWGIRRQVAEGWLVLPAVVLLIAWQFNSELALLHIRINWFPLGIRFGLGAVSNLLLTAVLFVLLFRRLLLSVREQRLMALDVKQAQEVQRVILPESMTTLPGLRIEHEYRPAREVGGDFYQMIPHATDGSLLIVAGDVAGKGLQAGMLVALLVGAIRGTSELNADPLFLLQALNRRLIGRREAHATCLAMRIAADGAVRLANAGHLPPYLNGQPIEIAGSLPLGMIDEAEFSITSFHLEQNDRLVLASDGIAEAMDEKGRLFGFDRVQELLEARKTAAEVAVAAQSFGQQDDISVIAVTRTATLVPA